MAAPKKAPIKNSTSSPKPTPINAYSVVNQEVLEEEIRQRAYELYEQRGRCDGFAEEDWFRAESEVRDRQVRRSA